VSGVPRSVATCIVILRSVATPIVILRSVATPIVILRSVATKDLLSTKDRSLNEPQWTQRTRGGSFRRDTVFRHEPELFVNGTRGELGAPETSLGRSQGFVRARATAESSRQLSPLRVLRSSAVHQAKRPSARIMHVIPSK
jgi:hypothetical protein